MSNHTRIFGSALPVGSDDMGDWPTDAGYFSDDFTERFSLDHYMDGVLVGTSGKQDGRHKQVIMKESSIAPTAKSRTGILYTKESLSETSLFYKDNSENGKEIKLTEGGSFKNKFSKTLNESYENFAKISDVIPIRSEQWTSGTAIKTQGSQPFWKYDINYPEGFTVSNSVILGVRIGFIDGSILSSSKVLRIIYFSEFDPLFYATSNQYQSWVFLYNDSIRCLYSTYDWGQEITIILGKLR